MSTRVLALSTRTGSDPIRRALDAIGPPLAAFALGWLVVLAASIHAGTGWPGAGDLQRGDAHNYVSIARHGYTIFYCSRPCLPGLPAGWWGNSGWFPLFPLLIAPFAHAGLSALTVGAVLASIFELAALTLLWVRFARPCRPVVGALVLATAAVFPGAIYAYAIFPLALFALLNLAAIALFLDRRWLAGGVAAGLAAVTYPPGVLLPAVAALWALLSGGRLRERVRRALLAGAPALVALFAFVLAQRLMTGHWDAFNRVHDHAGHNWQSPLVPLRRAKPETLSFLHDVGRTQLVPSVQISLVVLIVAAACVGWAISPQRRDDALVLGIVLAYWILPLALSDSNNYRNDAALVPALLLTRRLPAPVQAVLLAVVAAESFLLATLFFEHRLE